MLRLTVGARPTSNAAPRCRSQIPAFGRALRQQRAASRIARTRFAPCTPTICADAQVTPKRYNRRDTMRFMVIVKATKDSEVGKMPSEEMLAAMGKFNEEMVKAGIMLDGAGLRPTSQGARIRFTGNKSTVVDGPFAETKELIAG